MARAYKLKKYVVVKEETQTSSTKRDFTHDKAQIDQLNAKIGKLVEDPAYQLKAAQILSKMINSKK